MSVPLSLELREARSSTVTFVPVLFCLNLSIAMRRSSPCRRNLAVVGEFGSMNQIRGVKANETEPMNLWRVPCESVQCGGCQIL
jgi:hypothetical protein